MMASTVGRRSLPVLGQPSRSRRVTKATRVARTVTTCFSSDEKAAEKAVVKFILPKRVAFGQSIALVGSQEGLGAWDPKGAVGLEWHEGNEWVAEAELPVGEQIEYKYVVTSANGSVAWQPGKNMVLSVPADARKKVVVVVDDWEQKQKPAVKVEPAGEQLESPSEGELVESLDEELVQPFAKAVAPTAAAPAPPAAAIEAPPAPAPAPTPVLAEDPAPAPPAPVEAAAAAVEVAIPGSGSVDGTEKTAEGAAQQLQQQEQPRQEVAAAVNGMQQGGMGAVVGAATVSQPLEDMTVKALRELAKEYGVPVSGRKMDLVDRIKDAMGMAD